MMKITLTKGYVALVDDEDFERLSVYSWHAGVKPNGRVYALTSIKGKLTPMHSLILEVPHGLLPDHRNNNSLDNQRRNLRPATVSQNAANAGLRRRKRLDAPRFKGVTKCTRAATFMARIVVNYKIIHLGNHKTAEAAAMAYDDAARKHFGEFAVTNF